jgi:hypothetical protein
MTETKQTKEMSYQSSSHRQQEFFSAGSLMQQGAGSFYFSLLSLHHQKPKRMTKWIRDARLTRSQKDYYMVIMLVCDTEHSTAHHNVPKLN